MVDSIIYEVELLDSVALKSFLLKETSLLLACDQDVIQPVQFGCTLYIYIGSVSDAKRWSAVALWKQSPAQ